MNDVVEKRPVFLDIVCRAKLKAAPEWEHCAWEIVGEDAMIVKGGIPRLLTRGKRKGARRWDGKLDRLIVTDAEIEKAKADYEAETGKCSLCAGTAKEWWGWSVAEGSKYRPCSKCDATGAALSAATGLPQP